MTLSKSWALRIIVFMNMEPETESNDDWKQNFAADEQLNQNRSSRQIPEKITFFLSKRFLVAILLFFGNFYGITLNVNLNIAIVDMNSIKEITVGNTTIHRAEFNWNSKTIGMVQSLFAYGYMFCVVGAFVVNKFGGAVTFGISLMIMAILTILTPASLQISFWLFSCVRVLVGIFDGFAYSSSAEILSRWAPVPERSTLMSLSFCGIYASIAATYPICGFLAYRWGWRMIFYTTGIGCFMWSIVWLLLVRNQPSKDRLMSEAERIHILENTDTTPRKEVIHPYRKIFLSAPVWALFIGKFAYSCGCSILVTCLPLYVKDITQRNTDQVGLISSIPNFTCIFTIPLAGMIVDCWQNNRNLSSTQIHKITMSVGFISGSILFVIASFSTNFTLSMACFILTKIMLSSNYLILQLVCIYMSPKHASFVAAVSSFWYTASTIFMPNVVGFLTQNHSPQEWSRCFLLSAGILLCSAIIFIVYGSSELQPWSKPIASDADETAFTKKNTLHNET